MQGDPAFMRHVNGWLTIFWLLMIPISTAMGWLNSLVSDSARSLSALVSAHWSAWQAAWVEVNQAKAAEDLANGDVVDALIKRPNIQPCDPIPEPAIAGQRERHLPCGYCYPHDSEPWLLLAVALPPLRALLRRLADRAQARRPGATSTKLLSRAGASAEGIAGRRVTGVR